VAKNESSLDFKEALAKELAENALFVRYVFP